MGRQNRIHWARASWSSILLLITVVCVCCCKQRCQKTETEETRLFCHIFFIDGILDGGRTPCPPLATRMIVTSMLFVILRFFVLLCLFALVSMPKRH